MDLNTITAATFQAQFRRDFPYLDSIIYSDTQLYNTGNEVYYPPTLLFYNALVNGITGIAPGSDTSKWQLINDNIDNYVQDTDIQNAFGEAQIVFNQGLFDTDTDITIAYLLLSAHFLCEDIRAALAGINGAGSFPMNSRAVGSTSESYSIPEAYTKNPILTPYTTTTYGMKYLTILLPNLTGNVAAVWGGTNP